MAEIDVAATTLMLSNAAQGDETAAREITTLLYAQLRELARACLRRERPDHTLQPTALVNEAYIRLVDQSRIDWNDRGFFLGIAAREMRRVLIDHARSRNRAKRSGRWERVLLEQVSLSVEDHAVDILDIDEALERLSELNERQARLVELRFFAGLTVAEVAQILGVARQTLEKDWRMARAWLRRRLGG